MSVPQHVVKEGFQVITQELERVGWVKRKTGGNIYSTELSVELYGSLGLNNVVHGRQGFVEVNPLIGVGHHELEKIFTQLLDTKWTPYTGTALITNIGYLMPENSYKAWFYKAESDWRELAREMAGAIQEYGRPFLVSNSSLSALCQTMQTTNLGNPHLLECRIPIALLLLGRSMEAERFLEAQLGRIEGQSNPAATMYRSFATRFRELMKKSGGARN